MLTLSSHAGNVPPSLGGVHQLFAGCRDPLGAAGFSFRLICRSCDPPPTAAGSSSGALVARRPTLGANQMPPSFVGSYPGAEGEAGRLKSPMTAAPSVLHLLTSGDLAKFHPTKPTRCCSRASAAVFGCAGSCNTLAA
jgi:hypothetical protein